MKHKIYLLPALMAASSITFGATVEEQISTLEKEVDVLKSQYAADKREAIKVNGFFSFGAVQSSNELGYVTGASEDYNLDELSILGIQANADLGDNRSVTTQLLAKGNDDDFAPNVAWAYLSQEFDNGSTARVGRMSVPLFMYSDFKDVGIAQPWARTPVEVYDNVGFSAYTGADYIYTMDLDDSTLSFQGFLGYAKNDIEAASGSGSLAYDDLYGGSVTWTNDTLTLRGTYGTTEVTATNNTSGLNTLLAGAVADFYGIGLSYDNGSLLVISEYTKTEVEGIYSDVDSFYTTVGYRIDAWTPYVSLATFKTTDDDERTGAYAAYASSFNATSKATSVGTRYNFASNVSVKADITMVDDFDGTGGILFNTSTAFTDSTIYSVRVDTVF